MAAIILSFALTAGLAAAQARNPGQSTPPQTPPAAPAGVQTTPVPPPAAKAPVPQNQAPSASVAATQPVIVVHGVCDRPATGKSAGACNTAITRGQFERVVNAVAQPGQTVSPSARRSLAQNLAEYTAFAGAATKAGLDKDPRFAEIMRLHRLRTLSDLYRLNLEEKYRNPPPAEIEAYYKQNTSRFEEMTLSHLFVPKTNPAAKDKDKAAWEQKAVQVTNDLRERAAKGEDLEKLQKEAYATLGLDVPPPHTAMGMRRKGMLPPADDAIVQALKVGEVSQVVQQPQSYVVYKVEARQTLPLEKVKDEIARERYRQKMDAAFAKIREAAKIELNEAYFGPAAPAHAPPVTLPAPAPPPAAQPRPAPPK